jgi:hypothetical protein
MSNAELAPITKASCLCALNLSLTRLMLALLASHTAAGRSLVCAGPHLCALAYGPFAVPFGGCCGPFAVPRAEHSREQTRTTDQESQCSRGFRQRSRRGPRF